MKFWRNVAIASGVITFLGVSAINPAVGIVAVGFLAGMRVANAEPCTYVYAHRLINDSFPDDVRGFGNDSYETLCRRWYQVYPQVVGVKFATNASDQDRGIYYWEDRSSSFNSVQTCVRTKIINPYDAAYGGLFYYTGSDTGFQRYYEKFFQTGWACTARLAALASSSLGFTSTPTPTPTPSPSPSEMTSQMTSSLSMENSPEPVSSSIDEDVFYDASSEMPSSTPAPEIGPSPIAQKKEIDIPTLATISGILTVGAVSTAGVIVGCAVSQRRKGIQSQFNS